MICPSCLTECGGERKERTIRITLSYVYCVPDCCEKEAIRLQEREDLKRVGVRQERVAGLHRLSGIPDKFKETKFSDYKADLKNGLALKTAAIFAEKFPHKSVLLLGPIGTGKTMLGCAALNYIIDTKATEGKYIYTPDFFGLLRERINNTELTALTAAEVCRLHCVFFDDIGVDKDSEWTQSIYERIIDARYRDNRPTFMASNKGMAQLEEILGKRSMSRLVESYAIVEIQGKDRRMI